MDEHPGVLFRDGPAGRRATVVGGPDVWEVVRDIRAVRRAEPDLGEDELASLLEENTGVTHRMIQTALDYWGAYPGEVDALVESAERAEREHGEAASRVSSLLRT